MKSIIKYILFICAIYFASIFLSCKKIIEIPPPIGTITFTQVFSKDDQALSAMAAIYANMINSPIISKFSNGALSIYTGASADEIAFFQQSNSTYMEFQDNNLTSQNYLVNSYFWAPAYFSIYQANSIIEGLKTSKSVSENIKKELIGEALYIRAFCHFYLTNLYGDIPIVTTINFRKSSLLSRKSVDIVYQQIIEDLANAKSMLSDDYSWSNDERITPTKWAATAMLARVYLYLGKWDSAEVHSSSVIDNTLLFKLCDSLNGVFLKDSKEAIWQLKQDNSSGSLNATPEGKQIIPRNPSSQPFIFLTNQLLNSFEFGDKRKKIWVDSTEYPSNNGTIYYYPKKYKDGPTLTVNGPYKEYYMVLRLAEQFLIRAEARTQKNNFDGAIDDINMIRKRAELPILSAPLSKQQLLVWIEQERKIELMVEWGHRWFDLKRMGNADIVLSKIKGENWQLTDKLYPIPQIEVNAGPNLTQNDGY